MSTSTSISNIAHAHHPPGWISVESGDFQLQFHRFNNSYLLYENEAVILQVWTVGRAGAVTDTCIDPRSLPESCVREGLGFLQGEKPVLQKSCETSKWYSLYVICSCSTHPFFSFFGQYVLLSFVALTMDALELLNRMSKCLLLRVARGPGTNCVNKEKTMSTKFNIVTWN